MWDNISNGKGGAAYCMYMLVNKTVNSAYKHKCRFLVLSNFLAIQCFVLCIVN